MGMYGLGIIVAPAVGPTLGGYLVEYVDWRLIFFINVPVGILGTIAAVLLLPRFGPTPVGRFDVLGFLAVATGLVCLLLALTEGQNWGWTSYTIIILLDGRRAQPRAVRRDRAGGRRTRCSTSASSRTGRSPTRCC